MTTAKRVVKSAKSHDQTILRLLQHMTVMGRVHFGCMLRTACKNGHAALSHSVLLLHLFKKNAGEFSWCSGEDAG